MPFKFAFIGQDIPMHLPFLLVDFLYAGKEDGILAVEEKNAAMRDVLQHYAEAIVYASGRKAQIIVSGNRQDVLLCAGCVVYAGDCMAATRFRQDQDALGGVKEDDPGLSDQARVHGGIEGLMHTLRQGEVVLDLCRNMRSACPKAIVVTLGQPVARTTQLFLSAGFQRMGWMMPPIAETPCRGWQRRSFARRMRSRRSRRVCRASRSSCPCAKRARMLI